MSDFVSGFSITQRKNSRKAIKEYLVKEIKVTEECPFCHTTDIKRQKGYKKRWVYAVIDDQFAYCELKRHQYYCNPCQTFFFNTVNPRAYRQRDKFSKCFVEKALNLWLERNSLQQNDDEEKQISLGDIAAEIGITRSSISDWNKYLVHTALPRIIPTLHNSIILCSFVDIEGIRRGFICQKYDSEILPIAAIEEYSTRWIEKFIQTIDTSNTAGVTEVYYDYAPGLGMCLKEYFFQAHIGMNLNNLSARIRQCLSSFTADEANTYINGLNKKLFPVNKNDLYTIMFIPDDIREYIRKLPSKEYEQFRDLENRTNDDFIKNAFQINIARVSTQKFRDKVKRMIGNNQPFENIMISLLYNNPVYADLIRKAAQDTADEYGKKFEFITSSSSIIVDTSNSFLDI